MNRLLVVLPFFLIATAIFGSLVLPFNPTANAFTNDFQDNFESGSFNAWTAYSGATVQSSIKHGGSYAAHITANSQYFRKDRNDIGSGEFYRFWSFYLYFSSSPNNGYIIHLQGAAVQAYLKISSGKLYYETYQHEGVDNEVLSSISAGVWYKVVIDARTITLVAECWIDDVQKYTTTWTTGCLWNYANFGRSYSGSNDGCPDFYIDDVTYGSWYPHASYGSSFYDGYEMGIPTRWDYCSSASRSSSVKHNGTYSMYADGGGYARMDDSITASYGTAYLSAYVYITEYTGSDWTVGTDIISLGWLRMPAITTKSDHHLYMPWYSNADGWHVKDTGVAYTLNTWYHFELVFNKGVYWKCFIDGVLKAQMTEAELEDVDDYNSTDVAIGCYRNGGGVDAYYDDVSWTTTLSVYESCLTLLTSVGSGTVYLNGTAKTPATYGPYNLTDTVRLDATADEGFYFDHWYIDTSTYTDNPHILLMSTDHTVQAIFNSTLIHDIAVTQVVPSKNVVGQGCDVNITVRVANPGDCQETFNLTLHATIFIVNQNVTLQVASQNVTLESGNYANITFVVNTAGYPYGNYAISAYAWPILGESDTADNNLENGTVLVTVPGDVNGDREVDLKDVFAVGKAFGSVEGDPRYNPNLDINGDDKIDLKDYFATCKNYGKSW